LFTEPIVDSTDLEINERRTIERVMREVTGNKARASRELGITPTQLYMRLRRHGLARISAASI
jgi:transcriptional regulator with GAF, ATPase, and Fis domain